MANGLPVPVGALARNVTIAAEIRLAAIEDVFNRCTQAWRVAAIDPIAVDRADNRSLCEYLRACRRCLDGSVLRCWDRARNGDQ